MAAPSIFVSAGDPSGDNAAGRVGELLRERYPGLRLSGLGGPRLKNLGQTQLADPNDLAVVGFWEVAKRYGYFRALMHRCVDHIKREQPSLVLLVDYPGFNLRLARRIKSFGIPILYYISPQVWAWGPKRVKQIAELVDRMIVILPFEEEFFRRFDVPCDFVGHYLVEDIPDTFIGSPLPETPSLGLLPGSRKQEVERILPPMLEAAAQLHATHAIESTVAGIAGRFDYEAAVAPYRDKGVSLVYDDARRVVYESTAVLVASGTATLETGIIGRPMVIVYKTGWLTYQIARRLVSLTMIGLVNLVLDEQVVPELIQDDVTPSNMVAELTPIFDDEAYRARMLTKLHDVPLSLGGEGASQRAADVIGGYL